MYDIIGDIHGEAQALKQLLIKLGYEDTQGYYRHKDRQAIFLGDFINKGEDIQEVLSLAKNMTDHKAALAIVGNHELYLVGYFSKNKYGKYIREHNTANTEQHQQTFASFRNNEVALQEYIAWIKTLPLYLELENCRIIHAFWHEKSVAYLQKKYPENCLSDRLLHNLVQDNSREWDTLREILIGTKLKLPEEAGSELFKTKWWKINTSHRYFELATNPDEAKGNPAIDIPANAAEYNYPKNTKPLFFGHYSLPGLPYLTGSNHCCLDFSLPDRALIPAYRWQGEQQLTAEHIVY